MKNSIERVGIIGFGAMGQLMAEKMFDGCEVVAHDPNITEKQIGDVPLVDFDTALDVDATVLAVPAPSLHEVARNIAKSGVLEKANPLLVDICSVKTFPEVVFNYRLENHQEVLLSHPLFGPESAANSLQGHRVIVTEAKGDKAAELQERWKALGLNIIEMTANEHDREMAAIQAVPFIFGRLATRLELHDSVTLQTPSRLAVRKLEWLDEIQSQELFETITRFNPFVVGLLQELEAEVHALRRPNDRTERARELARHQDRYWPTREHAS